LEELVEVRGFANLKNSKERRLPVKLICYVAVFVIAPTIGLGIGKSLSRDKIQNYTDPQIPVGVYGELVSVDVVRSGGDIWIVDHKSGHLIFELDEKKETDKKNFKVFEELLLEASGNESDDKPSASYFSK